MRSPTELAPLLPNSRGAVFRIPGTRRTGETANGRVGAPATGRNADAEAFLGATWSRGIAFSFRGIGGLVDSSMALLLN